MLFVFSKTLNLQIRVHVSGVHVGFLNMVESVHEP